MAGEPVESTTNAPTERRPAVWPWLLIPLIALTLFFALQKVKSGTTAAEPEVTTESPATAEP